MAPLTWTPVWASPLTSCLYLPPPPLHTQAAGCTPHPEPQAGSLSLPPAGSYVLHTCLNLVKSLLCCNFRVHLSPRTRPLHPGKVQGIVLGFCPEASEIYPGSFLNPTALPHTRTHTDTHTHTHTRTHTHAQAHMHADTRTHTHRLTQASLLEKEKHGCLCRPRVWRREEESTGSPQGQGEGQLTWRLP